MPNSSPALVLVLVLVLGLGLHPVPLLAAAPFILPTQSPVAV
jgi:hypothetical protein